MYWNAFRPQETDYTAFAPSPRPCPPVQDGVVQPYADSPLDEEPLAETVYLDILSQAQRYVYIYTPYLAVGEEMLDALKSAAKRGVDVRLILPGIPDKKLVFRLSRSYYLPLLRAGVRIYEFTPGFLHAKCYVSDDRVAVVGSINMDYRSLFLHFECGTLLFHNSQIAALRKDVERTLPQCRENHAVRLPHQSAGHSAGQRAAAAESVDVSGCAQHSGSFSTQVKRAIPSPALLPAATGSHPSGHLLWKTPVGCVILRSSGHTMGQRPNGPCGKGAYL